MHGPHDLSYHLAASPDDEINDDTDLPTGPNLEHIFRTAVPHLRYPRVVTVHGEGQVADISRHLWQGGRFVLKCLLADRKVWFASLHDNHQGTSGERSPPPALLEREARITAPSGLEENVIR